MQADQAPVLDSLDQLVKHVEAAVPLTAGPAELRLALHAAANRFDRGHRIRVTIALADEGVVWVIPESPRPVVSVWGDARRPSRIMLPVIPPIPAR